jgi:hypothetical protein
MGSVKIFVSSNSSHAIASYLTVGCLSSVNWSNCTNIFLGFPFSFGIFQEYYTTHEPFSPEPLGIAIIGTTATV